MVALQPQANEECKWHIYPGLLSYLADAGQHTEPAPLGVMEHEHVELGTTGRCPRLVDGQEPPIRKNNPLRSDLPGGDWGVLGQDTVVCQRCGSCQNGEDGCQDG